MSDDDSNEDLESANSYFKSRGTLRGGPPMGESWFARAQRERHRRLIAREKAESEDRAFEMNAWKDEGDFRKLMIRHVFRIEAVSRIMLVAIVALGLAAIVVLLVKL